MSDRTTPTLGELYDLESQFKLRDHIMFNVSKPFKLLLKRVASERKVNMSAIVRQAVIAYLENTYPGYINLYKRLLEEEVAKGEK